jgi:hypothetical protein
MMSTTSLRTSVKRLSQAVLPRGEVVVTHAHPCQRADDLEAQALRALGRPWRPGDLLITIEMVEPCPDEGPHDHDDEVIIYHRTG